MTLMNESPPVLYIQKPSQQHITVRKIRNFLRLTPGWNYGEGHAFDEYIIKKAIDLHKLILSLAFSETDAFPGTDGTVTITVYHGDYCLEFTIKANGHIDYVLESNDAAIHQEANLALPQIRDILKQFRRERWRPFDSSTFGTTTVAENVFVPQLLHISARGFLLLTDNVLLHLE